MDVKICKYCSVEKPLSSFRKMKGKNGKEYVGHKCRECRNKKQSEWWDKNTELHKEYRQKNAKKIKKQTSAYKKTYRQTKHGKEMIRAGHTRRYYNPNTNFKSIKNHRSRMSRFLKGELLVCEEIGCNLQNFKDWLEFNFTNEMNWGNYGIYWNIDHTLPLTELKDELTSWKNIFPMKADANSAKHDKINDDIIKFKEQRLGEFLNRE